MTAFVDMVRSFRTSAWKYCAYIVRGADEELGFTPIRRGDMNRARRTVPSRRPRTRLPATVRIRCGAGTPTWGRRPADVCPEGDFAFAESDEMHMPIYLGAPAGHVLRYAPGGTSCKGQSFIRRDFEIVRGNSGPAR